MTEFHTQNALEIWAWFTVCLLVAPQTTFSTPFIWIKLSFGFLRLGLIRLGFDCIGGLGLS